MLPAWLQQWSLNPLGYRYSSIDNTSVLTARPLNPQPTSSKRAFIPPWSLGLFIEFRNTP